MKTSKVNCSLFSLMTVLAIAVFFTACTQENLSPEKDNIAPEVFVEKTELAQLLAEDNNFQTLQELNAKMVEGLNAKTDFDNLPLISEEQLSALSIQLMNNIPELKDLDALALENVLAQASNGSEVLLRNPCAPPVDACQCCRQIQTNSLASCSAAAYAVYLSGGTYQAYLDAYYGICVPNYYAAVALCPC